MNISEAIRYQTLLAGPTDPTPAGTSDPDVEGLAVCAARFLADRARTALGAGPDADQIVDAIRNRLAPTPPEAFGYRPPTPRNAPPAPLAAAADRRRRGTATWSGGSASVS